MKRPNGHRVANIEKVLFDQDEDFKMSLLTCKFKHISRSKGLITIVNDLNRTITDLRKEVNKLKAIVAEVTNTVYKDNK